MVLHIFSKRAIGQIDNTFVLEYKVQGASFVCIVSIVSRKGSVAIEAAGAPKFTVLRFWNKRTGNSETLAFKKITNLLFWKPRSCKL